MSDRQILEYLRHRGRGEPPLDFVGSVMSGVIATPQRQGSWFAPFTPPVALVGVAVAVLMAAIVVGQRPAGTPETSPSAVSSASDDPSPQAMPSLLEPGDSIEVDAVDAIGVWGSVTIERLAGVGGPDAASGDAWSIHFEIAYQAERMPSPAEFGVQDWTVALASDGTTVGRGAIILLVGAPTLDNYPQSYPDTRDIFTEPIGGRVVMTLDTDVLEEDLDLVYRPPGFASTVLVIPLHRANEPPDAGPVEPSPAVLDRDLLQAGRSVRLPIVSPDGAAGTITVERGEDVGGYPLVPDPSSQTHFFIELLATYDMDVAPETAQWGDLDWSIEGADGADVEAQLLRAFPEPEGRGALGNWPGATVPEDRYQGWMIFALPRDSANAALELVYRPPGVSEETRLAVRDAAGAPAPVAAEWPPPDPVYVAQDGLPFTVLESAQADALFVDADMCTNPIGGYTVSYPDSWYTNTALDNVPACSWFSPTFYELNPSGDMPEEIAMNITVFEGAVGFIWADLYTEQLIVGGFSARRAETGKTIDPETPTDVFQYDYLVRLDADSDGRRLWAFTGTDYGGDYELNKAVLDRIMASLEFADSTP